MNLKTTILLIAGAFLFGCVFSTSFLSCGKQHVPPAQNVNLKKFDSAQYWKDSCGTVWATFQQHVLKTEAEKQQFKDSIAELARLRGLKPKQVEGYTAFKESIGQSAIILPKLDSLTGIHSYSHKEEFWNFSALIDSMGKMKLFDTMYAEIDLLPYWEYTHKWLRGFGGYDHFATIKSNNPAVIITGAVNYRIEQKKPSRLGVGGAIGVDWFGRPTGIVGLVYKIL